jgi:hypothetical protein
LNRPIVKAYVAFATFGSINHGMVCTNWQVCLRQPLILGASRYSEFIQNVQRFSMKSSFNRDALIVTTLICGVVAAVIWATSRAESGVEQAVRGNFVAASFLSHLQLEGERLRRYEKEMFIYIANPTKRSAYVKEFTDTYDKTLALLDTMLTPSAKVFTPREQEEILAWKQAAIFYRNEFYSLSHKAESIALTTLTTEQRLSLTVEYNEAIKEGKDRFKQLLVGSTKMRATKEESAQTIVGNINVAFYKMRIGLLLGGAALIGVILFTLRRRQGLSVVKTM